jgi:hypothetical protein
MILFCVLLLLTGYERREKKERGKAKITVSTYIEYGSIERVQQGIVSGRFIYTFGHKD